MARIDIAQLGGILTSIKEGRGKRCCCKEDERSRYLGAVIYNARSHTAAFSSNDKLPVVFENAFEFENEKEPCSRCSKPCSPEQNIVSDTKFVCHRDSFSHSHKHKLLFPRILRFADPASWYNSE